MTSVFQKLTIYLVLLLPQIALAENMQLEVIPLQNRMVDEVIHIIHPLVAPGGTAYFLWCALWLIIFNHYYGHA